MNQAEEASGGRIAFDRFARTEVIELPFIMTDAVPASRTCWRLAEETILDPGFADVTVWVHGACAIHSGTPIREVSELSGVKLRAATQVTNQIFSMPGAEAIGMPVPGVTEALSKDAIDATGIR